MTASASSRPTPADPLRAIEAALAAALLLGGVALLSLPVAGWIGPWLLAAPGAALVAAHGLRRSRRGGAAPRPAMAILRRRRPGAAQALRRRLPSRRASRLLAAFALR